MTILRSRADSKAKPMIHQIFSISTREGGTIRISRDAHPIGRADVARVHCTGIVAGKLGQEEPAPIRSGRYGPMYSTFR